MPYCSLQTDVGNEADLQGTAAQAIGGTTQYLRQTLADLLAQLAPREERQEVEQEAGQDGQEAEQDNFSDTSLD